MDITVNYSYASAVHKSCAVEKLTVNGECYETGFGQVTILLDAPEDGGRNPEFVSVFRPVSSLGHMGQQSRDRLAEMIEKDLVHVIEVENQDWIDDALLSFCKAHNVGFVGPTLNCCDNQTQSSAETLVTRFFEPFEDMYGFIRNLKEGNFLVESRGQFYCSSRCANSLLKRAFRLEANPLYGQKSQRAYMLRLMNHSPFPVLMRVAGDAMKSKVSGPPPFVVQPNSRRLVNVGVPGRSAEDTAADRWKFEWLNVRQFGGEHVTASLEAAQVA